MEAGTGCGKVLGYLVPAIPLAAKKGKKLVVSTGTVALQEQLMGELPGLLEACGRTYRAMAVAKGVDPDDPVLGACREPCGDVEDRQVLDADVPGRRRTSVTPAWCAALPEPRPPPPVMGLKQG